MADPAVFGVIPQRVEPTPRWVRVRAGGVTLADSRSALLLVWFGPGRLPTYLFPSRDVRTDLLRPSGGAGDGVMVPHDVVTDDGVLAGAALLMRDPPAALAVGRDHWTFVWDGRVTWLEEALPLQVHARDPTKRVDAVPSERHVRVSVDGRLVAESRRPTAVFETDLPTRWYLPREDVDLDRLVASPTVSACPYKGTARYWSVEIDGRRHPDIAWAYPDPVPECPRIRDLVCFFNERVDLEVDGERLARPLTPWSESLPD